MSLCQHFAHGWTASDERNWATNLGGGEDVLDGDGNLGANAVTLDQADGVAALSTIVSEVARIVASLAWRSV